MDQDRILGLWTRFLMGECLPAEEHRDLLDALDRDDALRYRLLEDARTDALLRSLRRDRVSTPKRP